MQMKLVIILATVFVVLIFSQAATAATVTNVPVNPAKVNLASNDQISSITSGGLSTSPKKLVSFSGPGIPSNPNIYGDNVVFESSNAVPDFDVELWNIKTGTVSPLSNSNDMWEGHPKIWGNKVVWCDSSPPGAQYPISQIIYDDMGSGNWQTIDIGDYIPINPSIYGTSVVWQANCNVAPDYGRQVILYGGPGITKKALGYGKDPAIYGNNVVYIDVRNGYYRLYDYNLATGSERLLSTSSGEMAIPQIYDQNVVWTDTRYGDCDIFMYNLATNQLKQITTESATQYDPVIWGDNVAWADNRNGNYDIYSYNIKKGETTRQTNSSSNEKDPSLYGNTLVYTKDYNVWEQPLVYVAPTATASPVGGYYTTSKNVTLKMNVPGNIYYTKNGATPGTSSTRYTGPITISSSTVLKYIAVDLGGYKSNVYTQNYIIDRHPPLVISTNPRNLKTGVSRTATLIVKFNEKIKAGKSINLITVKDLTRKKYLSTTKSVSGNILYLKNSKRLPNTWYQVTVHSSSVKDYAGNNMAATYSFRFKTRR